MTESRGRADGPAALAFDHDEVSATSNILTSASVELDPAGETDTANRPLPADGPEAGIDTGRSDPMAYGDPNQPFVPLPPVDVTNSSAGGPGNGRSDDGIRAVRTATGVTLPVVSAVTGPYPGRVTVQTACENRLAVSLDRVQPLGRAHVVLDAGHGGTEPGSVGPSGLTEKDVNLEVALAVRDRLVQRGATVVMTRESDHNMTTATRGALADAVEPGLFVSIHHNGGAEASGDKPGIMAFTKADSAESDRFGGLFHRQMTSMLAEVAKDRADAHARYRTALDEYGAAVADYDRRVAELQATTVEPPAVVVVDGLEVAVARAPVEGAGPPPAVPTLEPVRPLTFAGGGNAGVRSWIRPDGQDYLSVLRTSGRVPAVLAELLYLTNPAEDELLNDPAFVAAEADAVADAIIDYFSGPDIGTADGYVDDQYYDQPTGGGGRRENCVEPDLGLD